jgi:hypothetical protein
VNVGGRCIPALASWALLAAAGISLVWPSLTCADPRSAPDSTQIKGVRLAIQVLDDVRIITPGGAIDTNRTGALWWSRPSINTRVQDLVLSSDGLLLSGKSGDWGISSVRARQGRLIPWTEIESIEARRGTHGGVAWGALAGLAIGSVYTIGDALNHINLFGPSREISATPLVVGFFGGAALGALIDRPGPWLPIYP